MSVNGHYINGSFSSVKRRNQGNGVPRPEIKNSKEGEVEIRKFEGKELGGEARAEEGPPGPRRGQAIGVIRVEMREEVGLTVIAPPIHRYQALLHPSRCHNFQT